MMTCIYNVCRAAVGAMLLTATLYGKADKIFVYSGNIRYYYSDQKQVNNGDMTHLAEYDFMEASTLYDPVASNHHFSFSHVGSMLKFTLSGLGGQIVKRLTLSAYDARMYDNSLDLGTESSNGINIRGGEILEAYLMTKATTNIAGERLFLYVTTADGKIYQTPLIGADIAAGKIYTIDATLAEYGLKGEGTESEPYKITGAGDLTKLAIMTNVGMINTQGKFFQLTTDIDMVGEEAWMPIGTDYNPFSGTFLGGNGSGGNRSISNLMHKRIPGHVGLFGRLKDATIKNVTVSGEKTQAVSAQATRAEELLVERGVMK